MIGYGSIFEVETAAGSGVFTALAEVYSAVAPSIEVDDIDVTNFDSPQRSREFIAGLSDRGMASAEMNYVANSATDQFIRTWHSNGETRDCKITYPNGASVNFSGYVKTYTTNIPVDDRITASFEIKVSGAVTLAAAAAPVNSVLPAISGLAETGQVLTALPGVWSDSPTFTYQWQEDDAGDGIFVNITGATGSTYTVVSGNEGNAIRVAVTGTNSAGNDTVNSAPTALVVP
jgi:predicted secreted protein